MSISFMQEHNKIKDYIYLNIDDISFSDLFKINKILSKDKDEEEFQKVLNIVETDKDCKMLLNFGLNTLIKKYIEITLVNFNSLPYEKFLTFKEIVGIIDDKSIVFKYLLFYEDITYKKVKIEGKFIKEVERKLFNKLKGNHKIILDTYYRSIYQGFVEDDDKYYKYKEDLRNELFYYYKICEKLNHRPNQKIINIMIERQNLYTDNIYLFMQFLSKEQINKLAKNNISNITKLIISTKANISSSDKYILSKLKYEYLKEVNKGLISYLNDIKYVKIEDVIFALSLKKYDNLFYKLYIKLMLFNQKELLEELDHKYNNKLLNIDNFKKQDSFFKYINLLDISSIDFHILNQLFVFNKDKLVGEKNNFLEESVLNYIKGNYKQFIDSSVTEMEHLFIKCCTKKEGFAVSNVFLDRINNLISNLKTDFVTKNYKLSIDILDDLKKNIDNAEQYKKGVKTTNDDNELLYDMKKVINDNISNINNENKTIELIKDTINNYKESKNTADCILNKMIYIKNIYYNLSLLSDKLENYYRFDDEELSKESKNICNITEKYIKELETIFELYVIYFILYVNNDIDKESKKKTYLTNCFLIDDICDLTHRGMGYKYHQYVEIYNDYIEEITKNKKLDEYINNYNFINNIRNLLYHGKYSSFDEYKNISQLIYIILIRLSLIYLRINK